jgi:hypothetical protein
MKPAVSVIGSVVCSVVLSAAVVVLSWPRPGAEVPDVRPEVIRTHLQYLADDRLEGRMSGTAGFDRAARYVVDQFKALGLEPAFDGSFQQPLSLRHTEPVGAESSITLRRGDDEEQFAFATDFVTSGDNRPQRFGVGLGRMPGDEEGRDNPSLIEQFQDPINTDRTKLPTRNHTRRGRAHRPDPDRDRIKVKRETDRCATIKHPNSRCHSGSATSAV